MRKEIVGLDHRHDAVLHCVLGVVIGLPDVIVKAVRLDDGMRNVDLTDERLGSTGGSAKIDSPDLRV